MVSIIIVNYNGYKDTCELIKSLKENETYPYELIIIDNASPCKDGELLVKKFPELSIICSDENLGFAKANNMGSKHAKGEFLFYLNNDTIVSTPTLEILVERLKMNPLIGCVSPKTTFWPQSDILQYAGATPMSVITLRNEFIGYNQKDNTQFNKAGETAFANGAAMMIRKSDLEIFGNIPEPYFLYYEEVDWSVQIQKAGFKIWYEPSATIGHKESASIGFQSPLQVYYHNRNRYIFARRTINNKSDRILSYLYQTLFAIPKRLITFIINQKFNLIKPLIKGTRDGLKYILSN